MNITERVFGILTNGNTLRINLWFDGINGNKVTVLGAEFLTVAMLIKANKITVIEGIADPGTAIYTAKDDGNLKADTFYIGQNNYGNQSFDALVVHESVHAVYDIRKAVIPWIDNEVAAYIAQGFFASNAGIPDNYVNTDSYVYLGKLIANDIIAGREIDDVVMGDLRDKLRTDPIYAGYINKTFIGDGLK